MELAELAELPSLLAAQSMELAELAELLSLSNTRESMAGLGPLERIQCGWASNGYKENEVMTMIGEVR